LHSSQPPLACEQTQENPQYKQQEAFEALGPPFTAKNNFNFHT
jgi:hypothetical protein